MSELNKNILTARVNIRRQSSYILDSTIPTITMTPDRQPAKQCRLSVETIGSVISSGLITVNGNTSEDFVFTENGVEIGEKDFTAISSITTVGISSGLISIQALNKIGQPIIQETNVYDNLSVRFYTKKGQAMMLKQGQEKVAEYKIMVEPDKVLRENDVIYPISGMSGFEKGQLIFVKPLYDFLGAIHHIEAEVVLI